MFEDLILPFLLAYYNRSKALIFCECNCIFYGGRVSWWV